MSIFRQLEIKFVIVQMRKNGAWEKYATGSGCGNTSSPNDTEEQTPTGLKEHEDNVSSTASAVLPTAGVMTVTLEDVDMPIDMESVAPDNPAELLPESSMLPLSSAVSRAIEVTDQLSSDDGETKVQMEDDKLSACHGSSNNDLSTYDPAKLAKQHIVGSIINMFVKNPCQPDSSYAFPKSGTRSFLHSWFYRAMPDGSRQKRLWLSYSISSDRAFCMDCMLFGGPSAAEVWAKTGFQGWDQRHGIRDICLHESSLGHREAEMAHLRWVGRKRIDQHLADQRNVQIEQNRQVVYVEIKAIKYLAKEMMALRGHFAFDGKFLNLFKLLAEFDQSSALYLAKLDAIRKRETKKKPELNFLSPGNVRRLLGIMKLMIVENIVSDVRRQGMCSLISDGTQDKSKLEAQCVILRYIEGYGDDSHPVERLVDVFTSGETSGKVLCDTILKSLDLAGVELDWLVGQSFDGASNMRGNISGLKTQIQQHAKKALYIWCHAHRLNLVVESVLACSVENSKTIGLMQELHTFFNGHKRHAVLVEMQANQRYCMTLKRVSETTRSWRSVEDGINTLIECYEVVTDALEALKASGTSDAVTVSSASGLLKRLDEFDVIVCLFVLRSILRVTGPVSRMLQGVGTDLAMASTMIEACIQQFRKCRNSVDDAWEKVMADAKTFAEKHGIEPKLHQKRQRKTKKMPGEQCSDERVFGEDQALKVNVYIRALDTVLVALEDRFSGENLVMLKQMQLFTPKSLSAKTLVTEEDIAEICEFYGLAAAEIARERNDFIQVYSDLESLVTMDQNVNHDQSEKLDDDDDCDPEEPGSDVNWMMQSFIKPLRIVQQISSYPHLSSLYKVLSTLAVSSCSAERVMSRIRIVKNRLRSTMVDDYFSALLVQSAEKDVLDKIVINDIINRFAAMSTPLRKHLIYS